MKCSICKSVSDTYDPYLDIAVEIRVRSSAPVFISWGTSACNVLLFPFFVQQQAANIVRALELFVKPDVLSGENAYMCAKWVPFFFSSQESCIQINLYYNSFVVICLSFFFFFKPPLRCKKKVPATKRFTVHRTSNVLTVSLKRFANFSGGKITKVN